MSSRSNGVTNVEFTVLKISCVTSSAACSTSCIRAAIAGRASSPAASWSQSRVAPVTRFAAAAVNML